MSEIHLSLSIKKISYTLFGLVGGLVVLHLIAHYIQYQHPLSYQWMDIVNRVDVGDEISIPTWVAQALLLVSSVVLGLIAFVAHKQQDERWRQWLLLAGLFLYASVDEGASLHELLAYLEAPDQLGVSSGFLTFLWVIPGAFIAMLIIVYFWRFWRSLPGRTQLLFALSAGLFLGGAIGAEMIGANYYSQHGPDSYMFSGIFAAIEEGLEMLGVVLFIYSLLEYLHNQQIEITLHLNN